MAASDDREINQASAVVLRPREGLRGFETEERNVACSVPRREAHQPIVCSITCGALVLFAQRRGKFHTSVITSIEGMRSRLISGLAV